METKSAILTLAMRIADYIVQAKEQKHVIAFHCDKQKEGRFFAGYVEEIDSDDFRLRWVNPRGEPDGAESFGWFHLSEIDWIESDTPYLRALVKLSAAWSQFEGLKTARWKTSESSIKKALQKCQDQNAVCSILYSDNPARPAKVASVDKLYAKLSLYTDDMKEDGSLFIRLDQIGAVRVGGIDEKQAEYLLANS